MSSASTRIVDSACLARICCVQDASHWFFNGTDKGSHTSFRDQVPTSSTSVCSISKMVLLALSQLPGEIGLRSASAFVHQRLRDTIDKARLDSKTEAKVLVIRIVAIERWRLAWASQVLKQIYAPEGSTIGKHCASTEDLRVLHGTGSATMYYEYKMTL